MTPHEREELLRLWVDVPECKPKDLFWHQCKGPECGWVWSLFEHPAEAYVTPDHASAIARDAMVGYIRDKDGIVTLKDKKGGVDLGKKYQVLAGFDPIVSDDSEILALVQACRRVAGKEKA